MSLARCCTLLLLAVGLVESLMLSPVDASEYAVGPPDVVVTDDPRVNALQICADDLGHLYIAYVVSVNTVPRELYVTRSCDGGMTWEDPIAVEQLNSLAYFGRIACDNLGNVYVLWRNILASRPVMFINVSHDFGLTWREDPILLTSGDPATSYNVDPEMTHDEQGNVYVVWKDEGEGSPGVYFNASHDFGETWRSSDLRIGPGLLPQITADALGHVYVLVCRLSSSSLFLSISSDYGETFTPGVRVNVGDLETDSGRIATDHSGNVTVGWGGHEISGCDFFVNVSSDFGQTFLPEDIRINTTSPRSVVGVFKGLEVGCSGQVYALWEDNRAGGLKLFTNRSLDYGLTWEPEDVRLSTQQNSVQDEAFTSTRNGHVYAAWSYVGGEVYINASCDDGATWSGEHRLNQPSDAGGVVLAADNMGNAYVSWGVVIGSSGIRFNWASPSVGLGIDGPTDPVWVPPEGLTFDYQVFASNNTASRIDNLMFFLDTTKPDGTTTPPFIGPVSASLPASFQRQKTLRLRIPGRVPPGEYLINLRVDGAVTDQNRMCIIKG